MEQICGRLLIALLGTENNRFRVLVVKEKWLESNGKFWIVLLENVRERSHNAACSKSKSFFSDEMNIIFF